MSEEDRRADILGCFIENAELTKIFYDSFEAYRSGERMQGDEKMEQTKPLLE